jgi:integrase
MCPQFTVRIQYQNGSLRLAKRKNGPDAWEFLWREETADGKRIRHTQRIGPVTQYPTKEAASKAVNGLKMEINQESYRRKLRNVSVSDLIDHFLETVLYNETESYSASTKRVMPDLLNRLIRLRWGTINIRDVRAGAVRHWLRNLRRKDGRALADSTKAKIRNVMRRLFNHAIEWEWLEQGKNVLKLVKQSAQPQKDPDPFEDKEVRLMLEALASPYREMVLVAVSFGLRQSEIFALQWRDFDFDDNELTIARNICYGQVGHCKTRASRATLPMARSVAVALCVWRKFTPYNHDHDWVFASIDTKGKTPIDSKHVMRAIIRPTAKRVGITRWVHWHAFRYTYGTCLLAAGVDIAVVHELMRHASPRTTLAFYIRARKHLKRDAQEQVDKLIFASDSDWPSALNDPNTPPDVRKRQKRDAIKHIDAMIVGGEDSDPQAELGQQPTEDENDDLV